MKKQRRKISKLKVFVAILIVICMVLVIKNIASKKTENAFSSNAALDNVAPELELLSEKTVVVLGQDCKVKATAKDNVDGDITNNIQVSGVDINKAGEYEANIWVTDNAGNRTEAKQKVIVREELTNGLPVLMYHFFYDNNRYSKQDNNWLNINDFEEQLKYLTENDYYFPTWEEVNSFVEGKTKLPSKSVVLTSDDGNASFFELAVPVMQKYKVPVTSFVVTDWYDYSQNINIDYVVWGSHSAAMHTAGANGKGAMVNWSYEEVLKDLNQSYEALLGKACVFCYPFGHYNETAIKALQNSKFIMAFTVEGGRVKPGMNKYVLPRVRVSDGNSLKYFINSVM